MHSGLLYVAVGAAGVLLTMAKILSFILHAFSATVILYQPVAAAVLLGMLVFCVLAVKLLGPAHV